MKVNELFENELLPKTTGKAMDFAKQLYFAATERNVKDPLSVAKKMVGMFANDVSKNIDELHKMKSMKKA